MVIFKDGRHYVVFISSEGAHLMPMFWYWWNGPLWEMATVSFLERME